MAIEVESCRSDLPAGSAAQRFAHAAVTCILAQGLGESAGRTSRAAWEKPCRLSGVSWVQPSARSSTSLGHFAAIQAARAGDGAPWDSLRSDTVMGSRQVSNRPGPAALPQGQTCRISSAS